MKRFLSAFMAITVALSLTACGGGDAKEPAASGASKTEGSKEASVPEGDVIKIGGLAPLTGAVAVYGNTCKNGVVMAIDEINSNGGVLGKQLSIEYLDEKGDPSEALNAYNRLKSDGVVAVIGDVTSKPSMAVAEAAAADRMPNVTPTATHPDVTTYGDNIFRVCFLDPFQGKTMAKFASENLSAKKVAVMYNTSDDYSSGIAAAFKEASESMDMEVTAFEGYGENDVDFKTQLTNIAQTNPDVIMLPDYYAKVALIAAQAREVGITCTLMGADGWDGVIGTVDADNISIIDNSYFCNHYSVQDESEKVQGFINNYNEKYGEQPSSFSALGYDAAYILANAIEKAGSTDNEAIIKALSETEYDGITGKMKFDADGNPIKSVSVIKIINGEYTLDSVVEPE